VSADLRAFFIAGAGFEPATFGLSASVLGCGYLICRSFFILPPVSARKASHDILDAIAAATPADASCIHHIAEGVLGCTSPC
jgi:hypothetical protein